MKRVLWVLCWVSWCVLQTSRADDLSADAQEASFNVSEYRVEGNTVLPAIDIERAVYPYLGSGKTIKDVSKARDSLEQTYRDQGYPTVLVDVPEQNVDSGIVRLRVTEGRVGKVNVIGSRYHTLTRIRDNLPSLQEDKVLYLAAFQQQLATVNHTADARVTPVLRPGKTPGTVEIDLKVEDSLPLHASLELNDRYSANTSRLRLQGMVRYDNLWQREHSLSFQYQTAPEDASEVRVLSASYTFPIPASPDMVALYAVSSHSNVAAVGNISVIGEGDIYGARFIMPLPSVDHYFQTLSLGVDHKDFRENVTLAGADTVRTPISYIPFTAQYNSTLQGKRGLTQFDVGANFGIRGIGDHDVDCLGQLVDEFGCKRYKAQPNYFYLKAGVHRTHKLHRGWSLTAGIDGQIANQPLISNEQYSAGGAESVRGYLESERMGDDAWHGVLELHGPSYARGALDQLFPLMFVEGADLRIQEPLPSQQAHFDIASAGAGIRLGAWHRLNLDLDAAHPFKDGTTTRAGDTRLHMRLAYEF